MNKLLNQSSVKGSKTVPASSPEELSHALYTNLARKVTKLEANCDSQWLTWALELGDKRFGNSYHISGTQVSQAIRA